MILGVFCVHFIKQVVNVRRLPSTFSAAFTNRKQGNDHRVMTLCSFFLSTFRSQRSAVGQATKKRITTTKLNSTLAIIPL